MRMEVLKLKSNMMRGIVVTRFQQFAESVMGKDYGPDDGVFGPSCDKLARAVQEKLGLEVDGVVGPATWGAMFEAVGKTTGGAEVYKRDGVRVIDGREAWQPTVGFLGTQRPWTGSDRNRIRGVVLHQTGCWMPEDPEVWRGIRSHCGVTRAGVLILTFPFEPLIWHAQDLSRFTIGIEVAGLLHGVVGDERSYWPQGARTHEVTEAQLRALDLLFVIIAESFAANGSAWEVVHAHRQATNQRMSDPGEVLWKKVGMKWLELIDGTDGGPEFRTGTGMPIPNEWNDKYPHRFWGR